MALGPELGGTASLLLFTSDYKQGHTLIRVLLLAVLGYGKRICCRGLSPVCRPEISAALDARQKGGKLNALSCSGMSSQPQRAI